MLIWCTVAKLKYRLSYSLEGTEDCCRLAKPLKLRNDDIGEAPISYRWWHGNDQLRYCNTQGWSMVTTEPQNHVGKRQRLLVVQQHRWDEEEIATWHILNAKTAHQSIYVVHCIRHGKGRGPFLSVASKDETRKLLLSPFRAGCVPCLSTCHPTCLLLAAKVWKHLKLDSERGWCQS